MNRSITAVIQEQQYDFLPLLNRRQYILVVHDEGGIADEGEDLPARISHSHTQGCRNLIAHAGIAVLDRVAKRTTRLPELLRDMLDHAVHSLPLLVSLGHGLTAIILVHLPIAQNLLQLAQRLTGIANDRNGCLLVRIE